MQLFRIICFGPTGANVAAVPHFTTVLVLDVISFFEKDDRLETLLPKLADATVGFDLVEVRNFVSQRLDNKCCQFFVASVSAIKVVEIENNNLLQNSRNSCGE